MQITAANECRDGPRMAHFAGVYLVAAWWAHAGGSRLLKDCIGIPMLGNSEQMPYCGP